MFGFKGQGVGLLDYTQNSARIGSGSGKRSTDFFISPIISSVGGKIFSDVDSQAGTLPESQNLKNQTSIPFNASDNLFYMSGQLVTINSQIGLYSLTTNLYSIQVPTKGIGFEYNIFDTTPLTPATRRLQLYCENPLNVFSIGVDNTANIASSTHNKGNTFTGDRLDLTQFHNLNALNLEDCFQSDLMILFPPNLKYLTLNPKITTLSDGSKLPASLLTFEGFWLTSGGNITIPSDFFENCNLTSLFLWRAANLVQFPLNTGLSNELLGSFDISHMTNLVEFCFGGNTVITTITLPTKTNWENFVFQDSNNTIATNIVTPQIENILDSLSLKTFILRGCSYSITRAVDNSDISSNLVYWWTFNNSWIGDITITTPKTSLKEFRTGNNTLRTGTQQNSHPIVNISGLTDTTYIDLSGSNVEDLVLPVNTVCTDLILFDNKLDIVTNPNLVSQINAITSLITLLLSNNGYIATSVGQDSLNGLGTDVDLSGLVNLVILQISNCGLVDDLILANVNKLTNFFASDNPDLTGITNLLSHTGLISISLKNTPKLVFSITNVFTALRLIRINNTKVQIIDISGVTATSTFSGIDFTNNAELTTIILCNVSGRMQMAASPTFSVDTNPLLTSITNCEFITYSNLIVNSNPFVVFNNVLLDQEFPFGVNNFVPRTIQIQDNGMSQTNVDNTINNIYSNIAKWSTYTLGRTLNIAGSNATPSGTYLPPSGYIQADAVTAGNDGTPANALEQVYVLVNQNIDFTTTKKYNWTITTS